MSEKLDSHYQNFNQGQECKNINFIMYGKNLKKNLGDKVLTKNRSFLIPPSPMLEFWPWFT